MSMKRDSAAVRLVKVGKMVEVSVVHYGRRGKIPIVRAVIVGRESSQVHAGVKMVLGEAVKRLRLTEEVHEKWLSEM